MYSGVGSSRGPPLLWALYLELPITANAVHKGAHTGLNLGHLGPTLPAQLLFVFKKKSAFCPWLECQTHDRIRRVASLNPDRNSSRIFFSRVNFVC